MEYYDLVFHFGDRRRTVLDILKNFYKYDHLLKDVDRLDPVPRNNDGMVTVFVSVIVDNPSERIPVKSDDDVKVMFERNSAVKEVHLYVTVEVVQPIASAGADEGTNQ